MYNVDKLKEQHDIERLAREAEKMIGISHALNIALTECSVSDVSEIAGAFDAMEDIAKSLAKDLTDYADGMTAEA